MITEGKVTKITSYGAFVELEKGISGLVHKSKLKDNINIKLYHDRYLFKYLPTPDSS